MDGLEIEFANHLVEDSNNDALSYTDCGFFFFLAVLLYGISFCRMWDWNADILLEQT